VQSSLYFETYEQALQARGSLVPWVSGLGEVQLQKEEDWDAQWRASFLNAGEGIFVAPDWHIIPYWKKPETSFSSIRINPGAGFGTGTHETTQLCLRALGKSWKCGKQALDFGSGSGILAIAMALRGMRVDAVEIDLLAQENALENAEHNGVRESIVFSALLPEKSYDLIVANILKNVLIAFADGLVSKLNPGGTLILSGLMEQDAFDVLEVYLKKTLVVGFRIDAFGSLALSCTGFFMKQEQFDFFFCSRTWVKTDRYEGNYLSWKQGFEVPWQYDRGRDKSLFLDVGKIKLILQSDADLLEERILQAGDCCHIPRGKKYTILACQESEILVVSTSEAQDVVLVEDRKAFVPLLCEPKKPLYIQKPWGFELIWAQTEGYVGKVLHIEKGHQLSLQYHRVKKMEEKRRKKAK